MYFAKQKFILAFLLLTIASCGIVRAQERRDPPQTPSWAIKTNLLYDITTTMNLGVEVRLGSKYTLELPVNYNPWTFNNNRKWKHILVQPELRYWVCEPFNGHFFGLHGHYAYYNVGGVNLSDFMSQHRFQGWLVGGGLSYGYQWILSNRWSLEGTIGVGYAFLDYDKYECPTCGPKVGSGTRHYVGITKAGITIIYIIK